MIDAFKTRPLAPHLTRRSDDVSKSNCIIFDKIELLLCKCCHQACCPQKQEQVTDILLWIECYLILVGINFQIPHVHARIYILPVHHWFSGDGWVTYDLCYPWAVALQKRLLDHWSWSWVDLTLYNEAFTRKAKLTACCKYWLNEHYKAHEWVYTPQPPPPPLPSCYT